MKPYRKIAVIAVMALTLAVYWGALGNPFHFDDILFLQNSRVTDPGDPISLIKPTQIRQITYLSFYVNYHMGGTLPRGYHALNLALHLANILAVYLFVGLLVQVLGSGIPEFCRQWLPLAATAVFALHPVQSEPVNYVYQRSVLWAGLFSLLALIAFLAAQRSRDNRVWYALVGLGFILGVAGKESALALPLVLLSYFWAQSRDMASFRASLDGVRALVLPLVGLMLFGAGWILYLLYKLEESTAGLGMLGVHPLGYFADEIQILVRYIAMLLWPVGLSVDHAPAISPFGSAYSLFCIGSVLVVLVAGFLLRRRLPLVSFLVLSFFCLLTPTSTIVPSADLMFEHRLYLPMIAGAPLIALGILALANAVRFSRSAPSITVAVIGTIVLVGYASIARERTRIWGDNIRLWADASAKAPSKARPHYNLGVAYLNIDREKARHEFLRAAEFRRAHAPTLYNLGWIEQTRGHYALARAYYREALEVDRNYWQAHHNLGNLEILEGRHAAALTEFQESARLRPDYWPAFQSLSTLQIQQGDFDGARANIERLLNMRPDLLDAYFLKAYALTELRLPSQAEEALKLLEAKDRDGSFKDRIGQLRARLKN